MIIKEKVTTLFGTEWNFVVYPFIVYTETPSLRTRRHEWSHVDQVRALIRVHGKVKGWLIFYIKYVYEAWWLQLPHEKRTVERASHMVESDPLYAPWIDEYKNCPEKDKFRGVTLR